MGDPLNIYDVRGFIQGDMPIYSLKRVQNIPITLDKAWDFFSSPLNLARITPKELKFQILRQSGGSASASEPRYDRNSFDRVYAGQLIEYKLNPLPGFRVYWMTEITHVVPGSYFVDEQRRGPYRMWHHQHHFREIEGGVEMTDIVYYQLPLGVLGVMARGIFVGRQLERIFDYRREKIEEIFGAFLTSVGGSERPLADR